ncbi:YvrJ family protein [Oceanobacillus senegalensis]
MTEVGFPVAVIFYLLHRMETEPVHSIHALPEKMNP